MCICNEILNGDVYIQLQTGDAVAWYLYSRNSPISHLIRNNFSFSFSFFTLLSAIVLRPVSHVLLQQGAFMSSLPPDINMYIVVQRNCSQRKDIVHRLQCLKDV